MMSWKWYGYAKHFCCASRCCWHMATLVNGKYLVSSVGCFHETSDVRERTEENRMPIGAGYYFETMVFPANKKGKITRNRELACDTYQTAEEAEVGHLAMCYKFDRESKQ